eukprot:UN04533
MAVLSLIVLISIISTAPSSAVLTISCNNAPCGHGYTTSYKMTTSNIQPPLPSTANVLDMESISSINNAPKCSMPGQECTFGASQYDTCCNRQSNKCQWYDMDIPGNKIGKCCVRNNAKGCVVDSDCCAQKGVCDKGFCLTQTEISFSAQIVSEKVKVPLELDGNNASKNVNISPLKELIIFIMLLVIVWNTYGLFYCYNKYDENKPLYDEDTDYDADYS